MTALTQLAAALAVALSLCVALQFFDATKLTRRQAEPVTSGFLRPRVDLGLRLMAFLLVALFPFLIGFAEFFSLKDTAVLPLLPLLALMFINPELTVPLNTTTELVFTKPLWGKTVTVHLATPYQAFNRETYRQLFNLVDTLPRYGVKRLKLSSPMFYTQTGELRKMAILDKGLNKRYARLTHAPTGRFDCLLGKISMLLSRDKRKRAGLTKINIVNWHTITIEL